MTMTMMTMMNKSVIISADNECPGAQSAPMSQGFRVRATVRNKDDSRNAFLRDLCPTAKVGP